MINYQLVVFGALKDFFPAKFNFDVAEKCTAKDLISLLKNNNPAASDVLEVCQLAVNDEFVDDDQPLENGAEVVLLPPFSGG